MSKLGISLGKAGLGFLGVATLFASTLAACSDDTTTQVCEPGAIRCVDASTHEVCLDDGSGYGAAQACAGSTPICSEDACVACVPGTTTCDNNGVATCQDDGTYGQTETCNGTTPVCSDGSCVACVPGTMTCTDAASTAMCQDDGTLSAPQSCPITTPACLNGTCVACSPGETACADDGSIVTCLPNGTYGAAEACSAPTSACLDGACVVCLPGTTTCNDEASTMTCALDGSGYSAPTQCLDPQPNCADGKCVTCLPGSTTCVNEATVATCFADGSNYGNPSVCDPTTPACYEGACYVCAPNSVRCADDFRTEKCLPDGSGYEPAELCPITEGCDAGACVNLCTLAEMNPSSLGCSFMSMKLDNYYNNTNDASQHDSLDVGNFYTDRSVEAQLYFVANGTNIEVAAGAPVTIPPLGFHVFTLSNPEIDSVSLLRSGGVYRVQTNMPVVAYHHSPKSATATNDSLLLLPDHTLKGNYVVASYPGTISPYPSYFSAIGLVDNTTFTFTPPQATAGGSGVSARSANQPLTLTLNRYSALNVVVQQQQGGDLSGTIITADQPVWVAGATECANIPNNTVTFCDFIGELMVPIEYWGTQYAGAHAPPRGNEHYHWRVFAGADNVQIQTDPPQTGFPITLNKGQFHQFATTDNVAFTGTGPFMPVQYLEGQNGGAGSGDPSMILMIPVEQFLTTHPFTTGTAYSVHYAQIVRQVGGADIYVDGNLVTGFTTFANYEVANWPVSEGTHNATSSEPFGLYVYGYTSVTSYAYPAGMRLLQLNNP